MRGEVGRGQDEGGTFRILTVPVPSPYRALPGGRAEGPRDPEEKMMRSARGGLEGLEALMVGASRADEEGRLTLFACQLLVFWAL